MEGLPEEGTEAARRRRGCRECAAQEETERRGRAAERKKVSLCITIRATGNGHVKRHRWQLSN